jgi:uncharacterized membrane protein YhaH (DUF805 family)
MNMTRRHWDACSLVSENVRTPAWFQYSPEGNVASFVSRFYFSPRGRTGRRLYWVFGVVPLFVVGLLVGFFTAHFGMSQDSLLWLLGLLMPIAAWIWICVGARRLHDIGLSGWWMILVLALPLAASYLLPDRLTQLPALLAIAVLGMVPGMLGDNRYGRDPRASAKAKHDSEDVRPG